MGFRIKGLNLTGAASGFTGDLIFMRAIAGCLVLHDGSCGLVRTKLQDLASRFKARLKSLSTVRSPSRVLIGQCSDLLSNFR